MHEMYKLEPGTGLREILRSWVDEGDRPWGYENTRRYPMYEVYPLREYTWSRDCARISTLDWDRMVELFEEDGWDERDPLILFFGRNGKVKVGEGNHRLGVAKELGWEDVPIRMVFQQEVDKNVDVCRPGSPHRKEMVRRKVEEDIWLQGIYDAIGLPPNPYWRKVDSVGYFLDKYRVDIRAWIKKRDEYLERQKECTCETGNEPCCGGI